MKGKVSVKKEINNEGKEIITELKIEKKTDLSADNEHEFNSVFYYKVSEESELYINARISTVVLNINHLSPINYKKFHEELMILSWSLEALGYDIIKDRLIWVEKLKNDKDFHNKLEALMDTLIPISEEEYNSIKK